MLGSDHLLDAFISALVARAVLQKRTARPATRAARRLARTEGWIHLPDSGSLKQLAES